MQAVISQAIKTGDLNVKAGTPIEQIEPLDESLYDKPEVGQMYRGLIDGTVCHLFADEVTFIELEHK